MAEKVIVEIEVDEKGAVKSLGKIDKEIDGVTDAASKAAKGTKGLGKAFKGVGVAVRGVGAALKAAGIGLIIGVVSSLTDVLMQNQAIMDGVNKTFNTLSIIFQQLTKPLFEVASAISENAEGFDALVRVGKSLLTIVFAPLKLAFIELQTIITGAQLLWEKSFLGDGDETKIKELENSLTGLKMELVELGTEVLNAGKAIGEDFGEALTELGDIASVASDAVVEGFNNVDLAAARSGANAIEQAKKLNAILEIEQQGLKEKFDLQAEQQRQIRDDVSKTIAVRTAANIKLGEILAEQAKLEKDNINSRISNLQLENNLLGQTDERTNAILTLRNELAEVDARVAGFRSEQLTNENSLLEEQKAILQSKRDTDIEVFEIEKNASIEKAATDAERIRMQMELEDELYAARKAAQDERLLDETEGTQAYQDILNERALLDANYATNKKKLGDEVFKFEETLAQKEKAMQAAGLSQGLANISTLAGEGSAIGKAAAVAQATMDTYKSGVAAYAAGSSVGGPAGLVLGPLAAGLAVAAGVANVKNILSTKTPGGGSGGGGALPSAAAGPSAPSVGQAISLTNPNNGNDNISESIEQGFSGSNMRAYVVGGDVSGQQQLDREIAQNATFG